jgi:hypothetical protein
MMFYSPFSRLAAETAPACLIRRSIVNGFLSILPRKTVLFHDLLRGTNDVGLRRGLQRNSTDLHSADRHTDPARRNAPISPDV